VAARGGPSRPLSSRRPVRDARSTSRSVEAVPDGVPQEGTGAVPAGAYNQRMADTSSDVVCGRYRVLGNLGKGAMGLVYMAHDPVLDRKVAIKQMTAEIADNEELRKRFYIEARAAARLNHPNIITVHELQESGGEIFMIMELLEGKSLAALIQAKPVPLSIEATLDVMAQVCDGLDYAHQRTIVHRDIKPANLFLTPSGAVKILDFGIARLGSMQMTAAGALIGTPDYMSPEQIRGDEIDRRTDLWAVGAVLYQLLSGSKPFEGRPLAKLLTAIAQTPHTPLLQRAPSVPKGISELVDRLLAKPRDGRPASAALVRDELRAILGRESSTSTKATLAEDEYEETVFMAVPSKAAAAQPAPPAVPPATMPPRAPAAATPPPAPAEREKTAEVEPTVLLGARRTPPPVQAAAPAAAAKAPARAAVAAPPPLPAPPASPAAVPKAAPAPPAAASRTTPTPAAKKRTLVAVAAGVVVLGLAIVGGSAWWYFRGATPAPAATEPATTSAPAPGPSGQAASPAAPPSPEAQPPVQTPPPAGEPATSQPQAPRSDVPAAARQPRAEPQRAAPAVPAETRATPPPATATTRPAAPPPSPARRGTEAGVETGVAAGAATRPGLSPETVDAFRGRTSGAADDSAATLAAVNRITYVLEQYVRALVNADADAIREYRPSLSPEESALMRARQLKVRLEDIRVQVDGTEAVARCRRRLEGTAATGSRIQEDAAVTFHLTRRTAGWVITDVK
jgi:eukaryotic-like serine/threonine-protein kinase